jgi:hypothetical protein
MKKVPATFECGGRTITVEKVKHFDDGDRTGDWKQEQAHIRILTANIPSDTQMQTFWHETTHAILETAGHSELSTDEGFVERISQLIWQVLKSSR